MAIRPPIEGRVARILNLRELAINRGTQDGVTQGMIFDVLDPKFEDITDPETGDVLGSVYRPKVQVRVFAVEERLALARTFKSKRVNLGGTGLGGLARAFEPPKWVERHETLKTNESTWQDLDESESIVKTGDPVVEALVIEGSAEPAGSRTLDFPEVARELVESFARWLESEGWETKEAVAAADYGGDLLAKRGKDELVIEVKSRRGPVGVPDLEQVIGWSVVHGEEPGRRYALVVGESGLTAEAAELARSRADMLDVYRARAGEGFENLNSLRALPPAEETT